MNKILVSFITGSAHFINKHIPFLGYYIEEEYINASKSMLN